PGVIIYPISSKKLRDYVRSMDLVDCKNYDYLSNHKLPDGSTYVTCDGLTFMRKVLENCQGRFDDIFEHNYLESTLIDMGEDPEYTDIVYSQIKEGYATPMYIRARIDEWKRVISGLMNGTIDSDQFSSKELFIAIALLHPSIELLRKINFTYGGDNNGYFIIRIQKNNGPPDGVSIITIADHPKSYQLALLFNEYQTSRQRQGGG